jgi:hypothetical protein
MIIYMKMKIHMLKTKQGRGGNIPFLIMIILLLSSCANYEKPLLDEPIPEEVSFSDDLVPYFETSCTYTAGCHDTGDIPPDLTEEFGYNSLITEGYVDPDNPPQSLLYTKVAPGGSMERYSTSRDTQMVLRWIEQGAINN